LSCSDSLFYEFEDDESLFTKSLNF